MSRDRKEEAFEAFVARFKNKGKKKVGPQHKKSKKEDMSKIQCYGCQKFGHFKRDCLEMANSKKRKGKQHASVANIEDEHPKKPKGDKCFFYFFALTSSIADDDDMWLVDSGA